MAMIGQHREPAPYGRKRLSGAAAMTVDGNGWHRHGLRPYPAQRGPFDSTPLVRLVGVGSLGHRQTWTAVVLDGVIRRQS